MLYIYTKYNHINFFIFSVRLAFKKIIIIIKIVWTPLMVHKLKFQKNFYFHMNESFLITGGNNRKKQSSLSLPEKIWFVSFLMGIFITCQSYIKNSFLVLISISLIEHILLAIFYFSKFFLLYLV